MSGCDPLRVHALHDGTLGSDSREEAARHVAQCAECTDALAELRALDALAMEEPDVPEGYFDRLPARIAARARRPRAVWARPATWAGALAAALLLAVVTPRLLDQPSVPDRERRAPSLATPTANAPRPQAAEALPPAAPTEAIPDRQPSPAAGGGRDKAAANEGPATAAVPSPPRSEPKREAPVPLPASAEARVAEAPAAHATRERLAAAPAAPAVVALDRAAPEEAEAGVAAQAAPAFADAAGTAPPVQQQKSAATAVVSGLAAGARAPTPAPRLLRARADRDRSAEEAQRPGAGLTPLRRAFDAAADAVRAGGDEGDRAALRRIAETYAAALVDADERARVARVLAELGLRPR